MLNINVNTLTNSLTFDHEEWAQENYLERDTEESIDDAIRRIIPEALADGNDWLDSCRSKEQIRAFIRNFRNLQDGDEVDYSALVEDWPTALDANHFYTQIQEAEESRLRKYHDVPETDEDDEEYEDAMQGYEDEIAEGIEDETNWIVLLVTHLEMWRAAQKWKALRSSLVVGELVRLHDDKDRALVGLFLGRLEVLVDGCVNDLAVDSVKIEEKLSLLSLAA